MSTQYIDLPVEGGAGGGIASINSDTTSAQQIVGGTGITVNTSAGTTTVTSSGSSGANQTLSNLTSPTSVNQNLLFQTDNTFDIGGPFPTTAARPAHIWAATALVAGSIGDTYMYEKTLHLGTNSGASAIELTLSGGEFELQIGASPYLVVETNTISDYGTVIVGGSVNGTTAGFLTEQYQVPVNTQAHNTVGLGCAKDLSTGFSVLSAGNAAICATGVTGLQVSGATGITTIGAASSTPQHVLNTATATPATGVGTLTNLPAGVSGNPAGYIQITVNGSTHYLPYF